MVAVSGRLQPDLALAWGVSHGVAEEIRHDLCQSCRIAVDPHRFLRELDAELLTASLDGRPYGCDRILDNFGDLDDGGTQAQLAPTDPRDFEQVIDQPDKLLRLPSHGVRDALDTAAIAGGALQNLDARADRSQRVAQLMCQHREKLVFVAICLV